MTVTMSDIRTTCRKTKSSNPRLLVNLYARSAEKSGFRHETLKSFQCARTVRGSTNVCGNSRQRLATFPLLVEDLGERKDFAASAVENQSSNGNTDREQDDAIGHAESHSRKLFWKFRFPDEPLNGEKYGQR